MKDNDCHIILLLPTLVKEHITLDKSVLATHDYFCCSQSVIYISLFCRQCPFTGKMLWSNNYMNALGAHTSTTTNFVGTYTCGPVEVNPERHDCIVD